ncbi:MAG: nitrilase-related carbon-nitrogen hydrolase [candidate division WOR-3 bacterium]
MRIGLIQHNVARPRERGLRRVVQLANNLEGPDLVLLPELFASGYGFSDIDAEAKASREEVIPLMEDIARGLSAWVAGTLILEEEGTYQNTFVMLDRKGNPVHSQAKTHLFKPMDEHRLFSPGGEIKAFETEFGRAGALICYELRFPEIARKLTRQGARIILVPAEWPLARVSAWQTLCRARAMENQVFLVACNRWGGDKVFFGGRSGIYDPAGEPVVEIHDGEGIAWADVDLSAIDEARKNLPCWEDRREELY